MDKKTEFLVEIELYKAIRTFLEIEDKEEGKELSKEYIKYFCRENNADINEVYAKLIKMIEGKQYSHINEIEFDED